MSDLSHKEERYKEYDHAEKMRRGYHFTIDVNGVWYCHDPAMSVGVFRNERLAALFSGAGKGFMAGKGLSVDDCGDYWLKSPHAAYKVEVEDVPFVVEKCEVRGKGTAQKIDFTTNHGEVIALERGVSLSYKDIPVLRGMALYVEVRAGLQARLGRSVNDEILNHYVYEREESGQMIWYIQSRNAEFVVMRSDG